MELKDKLQLILEETECILRVYYPTYEPEERAHQTIILKTIFPNRQIHIYQNKQPYHWQYIYITPKEKEQLSNLARMTGGHLLVTLNPATLPITNDELPDEDKFGESPLVATFEIIEDPQTILKIKNHTITTKIIT